METPLSGDGGTTRAPSFTTDEQALPGLSKVPVENPGSYDLEKVLNEVVDLSVLAPFHFQYAPN